MTESGSQPKTPLEEIIEKRGAPGVSSLPVQFLERFELKDVLPLPDQTEKSHDSASHS